jgi:hypothetical protein
VGVEGALEASDPRILGAYRLVARVAERNAGLVFRAEGRSGEQVFVVALGAAAASDPGVRARFESLVAGAIAAQPRGLMGWAALPDVDAGVRVLEEAALTSGGGAGPGFVPHWVDEPRTQSAALEPPRPPASPQRRVVVAMAVSVWCLIMGIVAWDMFSSGLHEWRSARNMNRLISKSPPPFSVPPFPTPSTSSPTPEPSAAAPNGKPGLVAGPTYGEGEKTYHMKLRGFPFEFDAPGTWGCMRSDKEPFDSRWICVDDGGRFGGAGSGAGGMVAVEQCPGNCEEKRLERTLVVDAADWRRTDSSTMYAEIVGEDADGQRVVRVAMTHVHDGTGIVVQLTGPPDQKATMQKLINEIRART